MGLPEKIDAFVKWFLEGYRPQIRDEGKVINDALLGNQFFLPHELAIIDSPLFQRLRRIKQTGLVYLVYPSAVHSRFEHCLGAVSLAERSLESVTKRALNEEKQRIAFDSSTEGDLQHLRVAALLHDIGHGFFSHTSEQIYKWLPDIGKMKQDPKYVDNAAGEIISYLIVTSPFFGEWFENHVNGDHKMKLSLDLIGKLILGVSDDPEKQYLADIISGPFDADKLDYVARDGYYCGLALTVDLGRFFYTVGTAKDPQTKKRIVVLRSYVPMEQITFSKMLLYGSVYHHHKVKACDVMVYSLVEHIRENAPAGITIPSSRGEEKTINFSEPSEYLYLTDDDLLNEFVSSDDAFVSQMLTRLRNRDLFYRCLEVSGQTVGNWNTPNKKGLTELSARPDRLTQVRQEIFANITGNRKCSLKEVGLSFPSLPELKGKKLAYSQRRVSEALLEVEDLFPVPQWVEAYANHKWKGFIFAPLEHRQSVCDSAFEVLGAKGIQFNEHARKNCKL
ncbi:HD domain-containing protein [Acidobacteria bacterium AH-259-D05]|nr:HD domain-containing protein [Acidobacteria bacterium AH-259-D05]